MNKLISLKNYISNNLFDLVFVVIVTCIAFFSLCNLTTTPRIWTDEPITMELAHNFLKFGVLDIQTSPGQFSGTPYLLQSSGYPLTIPLSLAFGIFGYSLEVSRSFMLYLLIMVLYFTYFFGKKMFGDLNSIAAILLISTFASFYGNGLTAVG